MAVEILLRNEVAQEIETNSTTEFSTARLVPQNFLNEGTPNYLLLKEIPHQSEANYEVMVGIVG